jgi:DNA replication and repair protein RecF
MGAARLTRLCVTDFRSYANADIRFDGRPVAIAGANGAGKTNLLEAISLVGPGRGVRGARLEELPRIGGPGGWAVSLRVDDGEDERRFGVGAEAARPDRRVCRIDDAPASGPGVFSEHLRFLWLTPAMDRLFMEGAGERRKFLDRMTLAHEPSHGKQSSAYEQAMRQRQRLLDEGETDDRWLSALEAQMAEAGVAIAAARRNMVERLSKADVADGDEFFPAADIVLDGEIEAALASQEVSNVEADYLTELRRRRRLDADAGRALAGPHRSDLLVSHREKNRAAKL